MTTDKAVAPPAVAHVMLCAICLHANNEVAATTTVNGTSLCTPHAREAPRSALPYGED